MSFTNHNHHQAGASISYPTSTQHTHTTIMEHMKPTAANSQPLTPIPFIQRAATVYGDCTSIIYNDTVFTWSQTYTRCRQLASSLIKKLGISKGDVVSVVAQNIPTMYELHFAVPMAGAVLNTINTRLDSRTVSLLLRHSGAKLVFVDCELVSLAAEAMGLIPENESKPTLVLISDKYSSKVGESCEISNMFFTTYEDLVGNGDSEFEWLMPETEWDPIVLNYTSGTTSAPKGVVHSHRGVLLGTMDSLLDWPVPKQAVCLWTLPMFHANGWTYTWGIAAVGGVNVCLRKFDGAVIYDLIEKHGVTHMCGAPVVLNMLTGVKDAKPLRRKVNVMTAGAAPPASVLSKTESLGFIVSHGYGMTETAGHVVTCAWKEKWNHLSHRDKAKLKARQGVTTLAVSKVEVMDPSTNFPVPKDGKTVGEIVIQSGSVMLGYLKNPDETKKTLRNGKLHTGDLAVVYEDGYLQIKDRSKDVIISGGENVSSLEVESVLFTHPCIAEAAVVAKPDEYWGETPCAFVVLKCGMALNEKSVIEYCRERLPHYMVPKRLVFVGELPKTSTGKVKKYALREMARKLGAEEKMKISRL